MLNYQQIFVLLNNDKNPLCKGFSQNLNEQNVDNFDFKKDRKESFFETILNN